ncbi:hypothetical protein DFH08DRAFT_944981 [Mycena albidolilacea]|uniref:Uncharacterized protein n=1 Tax=Mycena albidolilacea TaxID=1033008 RepID=A0AAD6Z2U3_9AGAR|nr:hypothetical protein DFH08DRAFT_944981 [Mycena albidolilacea]
MTGFLNVEAGLRAPAARPSLSTYVCLLSHPLILPPCAPYRRRWLQGWLVVALVFIQRPDAELITARILNASLSTRRKIADSGTSREELQTTSRTPLRLMIVLGGDDGSDNATPDEAAHRVGATREDATLRSMSAASILHLASAYMYSSRLNSRQCVSSGAQVKKGRAVQWEAGK